MAEYTKIKIRNFGSPIINRKFGALIVKKSDDIICVSIDCKSKYLNVDSYSDDTVYVVASPDSYKLNSKKPRNEPTGISFPELKGWKFFTFGQTKYGIHVTLIKD